VKRGAGVSRAAGPAGPRVARCAARPHVGPRATYTRSPAPPGNANRLRDAGKPRVSSAASRPPLRSRGWPLQLGQPRAASLARMATSSASARFFRRSRPPRGCARAAGRTPYPARAAAAMRCACAVASGWRPRSRPALERRRRDLLHAAHVHLAAPHLLDTHHLPMDVLHQLAGLERRVGALLGEPPHLLSHDGEAFAGLPARAASIAAFSASRFVMSASSRIDAMNPVMRRLTWPSSCTLAELSPTNSSAPPAARGAADLLAVAVGDLASRARGLGRLRAVLRHAARHLGELSVASSPPDTSPSRPARLRG